MPARRAASALSCRWIYFCFALFCVRDWSNGPQTAVRLRFFFMSLFTRRQVATVGRRVAPACASYIAKPLSANTADPTTQFRVQQSDHAGAPLGGRGRHNRAQFTITTTSVQRRCQDQPGPHGLLLASRPPPIPLPSPTLLPVRGRDVGTLRRSSPRRAILRPSAVESVSGALHLLKASAVFACESRRRLRGGIFLFPVGDDRVVHRRPPAGNMS